MVERNMEKKGSFLESIVTVAIVLVLVQTFLEDWAVVAGWSWDVRSIMVFTGFFFDLFFTIEFLTRLYFSVYRGRVKEYFFYERGWIDFFASIPLLVLNSGPLALTLMTGASFGITVGGTLNILKVVKAIRIARILRLLRTLKIFKQIKNAESPMTQRHVTKIATISISVLVFGLLIFTIASDALGFPSVEDVFAVEKETVIRNIPEDAGTNPAALENYASGEKNLLVVRYRGDTVYSRYDNHFYSQWFGPHDYEYTAEKEWEFFFDARMIAGAGAKQNLMFFVIVILTVLAHVFFYSPHFALTISDPVHVMRRGLNEQSYNLEVRIPERYKDDDIYRLAASYNEVYLPLKDRNRDDQEGAGSLDLKIEDLGNLFED